MQLPLLHQQIILNTEKVRELHRSLMLHSVIPANEMEHFLNEIRRLYETALQLQHSNALAALHEMEKSIKDQQSAAVAKDNKASGEEVKIFPAPVVAEVPAVTPTPVKETPPAPAKEKEIIPEPVVAKAPEVKVVQSTPEAKPLTKGIKTEEAVKAKPAGELHDRYEESETLADRFSDSERIGDKLAKHPSKRLSDQLKTPIKDLRAAIGLNEKFQFINQLFEGNSVGYNTAIDFLNNCSDMNQAHEYLNRISNENHWEKNASVASSFIDLVDRRVSA